jgi:tetratricopeptide (TPR) repeat protein
MDEDEALRRINSAFDKWYSQGRRDEAISDLKTLCTLDVGDYERGTALCYLGMFYEESQRWTEAKEAFLEAIPLYEAMPLYFAEFSRFQIRYDIAQVCCSQNELPEAAYWLQECIKVVLRDPAVYVGPVYKLLHKYGDHESAFADVRKSLETALQMNWEYLIPEEPFPENIDLCMWKLDQAEERRCERGG